MTNHMKPYLLGEIPSHPRRTLIRAAGATALLSMLAFTSGCVVAVRPAPVATVYAEPQEVVVDLGAAAPHHRIHRRRPRARVLLDRRRLLPLVGSPLGVWYRGHYERPPHPGARWFGPRYELRGGRRVYIRGYWR